MKVPRLRMPKVAVVGRFKGLALISLVVAGSFLSITTSLLTATMASAITDDQKTYCVTHYGEDGTRVVNDDWDANKCAEICTTSLGNFSGLTTTTGCNRDKVASESGPAIKDTKTDDVLRKGYSDAGVAAICGGNNVCASKMRTDVTDCVNAYLANGYENDSTVVYPDMDPAVLATCMSNAEKGYTAAQVAKIKKAFDSKHDEITKAATASSQSTSKEACEKTDGNKWNTTTNQCDQPVAKSTCAIDNIGWLICPAMTFMANINDKAYSFLASNFLSVNTGLVDGSRDAWAKFRDIANVLFVIAFLVVVYSQLTSVGISNYGIKRMLPRIVVAALLVNMSFIICQVAVDLSNILGYGITKIFDGLVVGQSAPGSSEGLAVLGSNLTWAAGIAAVIGVAVGVALAVSVPVLLAGTLAIGLIVLILIGRQALIVLLIAIAPVAFVAYLLPNTEQWFKKWVKMFSTLLLLFPIIGVVFGASKLAAEVINGPVATGGNAALIQITALGVSAVPFFVVPGMLKGALNAAGSVGTKLQGLSNKATGKVGSRVKDSSMLGAVSKQYGRNKELKRAQTLGGMAGGRATKGWYKSVNRATGKYGDRISAQAAGTAQKLRSEDVENEVARMQSGWAPHEELEKASDAYDEALKAGDVVKTRASQKILLSKGNAGIGEIRKRVENLGDTKNDAVSFARADLASAGLKPKDAALNAWSYDSKQRSLKEVDDDAGTYNGLSDSELSTQTDSTLKRAVTAKEIDKSGNVVQGTTGLGKERATRVLGSTELQANLNENKYKVLRGVAGVTTTNQATAGGQTIPTPTPSPATSPPSTPPPAGTNAGPPTGGAPFNVPHGGGNNNPPTPPPTGGGTNTP